MDPFDQCPFMVALKAFFQGDLGRLVNGLDALPTVDYRLTVALHVEAGIVKREKFPWLLRTYV
jgi:hypothetical protein